MKRFTQFLSMLNILIPNYDLFILHNLHNFKNYKIIFLIQIFADHILRIKKFPYYTNLFMLYCDSVVYNLIINYHNIRLSKLLPSASTVEKKTFFIK